MEIMRLHGVPNKIISYRVVKFTFRFFEVVVCRLGDIVNFKYKLPFVDRWKFIEV